jgi:hypothetical protein
MENVEKLRVMLQHWIEHNMGHVEEFEKWQATMTEDGQPSLAIHIADAIKTMGEVNVQLEKALEEAGGPSEEGHHHHH